VAENTYLATAGFGTSLTSSADTMNSTWPNVTFNHFEARGAGYQQVSGARVVYMAPIVQDLDSWNSYSLEHQAWIKESYMMRGDTRTPDPIEQQVYRREDGVMIPEINGDEFYLPIWQASAAPYDTSIFNLNLLSVPELVRDFDLMMKTKEPVLTNIIDFSTVIGGDVESENMTELQESALMFPIFDSFGGSSGNIVGVIFAVVPWIDRFSKLLHDGSDNIICVLRNACGDVFSYGIQGSQSTYLGSGDSFVDTKFAYLEHVVFIGVDAVDKRVCEYTMHLYPTAEMEANYQSDRPFVYTAVVAAIFVFACTVFVVYDWLVAMRLKKVNKAASKSATIVASLFPDGVRSRLLNPEELILRKSKTTKSQLKAYLQDDSGPLALNKATRGEVDHEILQSKPIADLFPNTTVIFADIAGFTAWSSVREPSQVFTLLETVYRAFDRIAHHRGVFKVETVGDCYVAVTGLPEPREDHAVAMARFARDCMVKMNDLTHKLEITLGPDTGELAMRFGMHSGPVTAGVLRGDKSRFQLFGDTVNTAARIESTGVKNRIHLSQETANLLFASEKKNWVIPRDDMVIAKGKGKIKTFWLIPSGYKAHEYQKTLLDSGVKKAMSERAGEGVIPSLTEESTKILRLVDWTGEVLKRLLKQVVANRALQETAHISSELEIRAAEDAIFAQESNTLDEVEEVVKLPLYNASMQRSRLIAHDMELPEKAVEQLVEYVRSIATLYRSNSFHNFEHASHVTMSVSKLLSRIVAPDIDFQKNEVALHDHTYGITSDPLTQFAVVLSALIHDVDHVGIPNYLLIEENKELGEKYKNKSVAEQNSVDLAWAMLMQSKFSDLRRCIYQDVAELSRFRKLVVNTLLATDIFDGELQALRKARWNKAFSKESQRRGSAPENDVNRKATIVIEHLIQASDVAHTMQHWHIYQKWNERLFEEMYVAFKAGRSSKNPALNWYEGELGFFDHYIIPLAKKLKDCGVFGVSSDEYLNYAMENRNEWASKGKKVVVMLMAKHADVEVEAESQKTNHQQYPKPDPVSQPDSLIQPAGLTRKSSVLRRNSLR
jgi:class 3 adenylate cyclase